MELHKITRHSYLLDIQNVSRCLWHAVQHPRNGSEPTAGLPGFRPPDPFPARDSSPLTHYTANLSYFYAQSLFSLIRSSVSLAFFFFTRNVKLLQKIVSLLFQKAWPEYLHDPPDTTFNPHRHSNTSRPLKINLSQIIYILNVRRHYLYFNFDKPQAWKDSDKWSYRCAFFSLVFVFSTSLSIPSCVQAALTSRGEMW